MRRTMRRVVPSVLTRRSVGAIIAVLVFVSAFGMATALTFEATAAAPLVGVPVPSNMLPTIKSAALSCPALSPPRLAGQIMAESGFKTDATTSRGGKGVAGLTDAEWNMWRPSSTAKRTDPNANIVALSHEMCDLVGTLRAAKVNVDLWQGALAAFHSSVAAVTAARGIPAVAQSYVDMVVGYTSWYQTTPQFGGIATRSPPTIRQTTQPAAPTPLPSAKTSEANKAAIATSPQHSPVPVNPSASDSTTAPPRTLCVDRPAGDAANTLYVLDVNLLCSGNSPIDWYEIGVDTSGQLRSWLEAQPDALRMNYPGGQSWGAVFVTVGPAVPPGNRPGQDLSHCSTLLVDLRSPTPDAALSVGMKDSADTDDGSEVKVRVNPGDSWITYSVSLDLFVGLNTASVYVLTEFVFETGDPQQTVDFRNIRFVCSR